MELTAERFWGIDSSAEKIVSDKGNKQSLLALFYGICRVSVEPIKVLPKDKTGNFSTSLGTQSMPKDQKVSPFQFEAIDNTEWKHTWSSSSDRRTRTICLSNKPLMDKRNHTLLAVSQDAWRNIIANASHFSLVRTHGNGNPEFGKGLFPNGSSINSGALDLFLRPMKKRGESKKHGNSIMGHTEGKVVNGGRRNDGQWHEISASSLLLTMFWTNSNQARNHLTHLPHHL